MQTALIPNDRDRFNLNHFNTLRLAMAVLVVWSHSFAIYLGTEDNEPISLLLNGHYNAGNIGVRVFFAVSGLLIARSFEQTRSMYSYFEKRVRRIYPGYLVAVAVCAFVIVPVFSADYSLLKPAIMFEWTWKNLLLRNFIPPSDAFNANPITAVNGALWSIAFEFWCYIGIAILGVCGLLRKPWAILSVLVLIMLIKVGLDLTGRKPGGGIIGEVIGWPYLWTSMAPSFLIGVVAHKYGHLIPRSRRIFFGLIVVTICCAHISDVNRIAFDLLFIPTLGYVVFFVAFSEIQIPDAAKFGDFSYGTYLYGFPIQQMVKLVIPLNLPTYIAVSVILSLIAGALSWFIVERQFTGAGTRQSAVKGAIPAT